MIFKIRTYHFILFVFLGFLEIHGQTTNLNLDIQVIFKKVSHQNPWVIKEPIRNSGKAISLGKNRYLALSLPNEEPLYGELIHRNKPNAKLRVIKYDKSTGIILFQSDSPQPGSPVTINSGRSSKSCHYKNFQYINLSFSSVPIRAVKLDRVDLGGKDSDEFFFSKGILCGYLMGSYLIPTEYFEHFVTQQESSPIPHPGFEFESALNSSERSFYFPNQRKGILVTKVFPGFGPNFQLLPGDAIYEINGTPLNRFPDSQLGDRALDLLLRTNHGLKKNQTQTKLKFVRNGRDSEVQYSIQHYSDRDFLVPDSHPYGKPPFLIMGGLFFTELTGSYLKEFGENYRAKSEKKLLYIAESFHSKTHPHRERLVILSRLLLHPNNQGYQEFQDLILDRVNGKNVKNLKNLKNAILSNRSEFTSFEFSGGRTIIFHRDELAQINQDILKNYNLNSLDNLGE